MEALNDHANDCTCSHCRGREVVCRRCRQLIKLKEPYRGDPDYYECYDCKYPDRM